MATINIGQSNQDDQFYRYKMPRLQARIEGRGNGIKTNVVNNTDIAKALERPPEYIVKFYGCELGAQTKYDKATGTSIVNGAHDVKKLSELLEGFIKRYVQCHSCGNPETQVKIRKDAIFLKCKACGFTSDVDMRHKLNTFILKNPPEEKLSKAEKKLKKIEKERMKEAAGDNLDKEEKKRKKKEKDAKKMKGKGEDNSPDGSVGDDDENGDKSTEDPPENIVWMTDTSEAAAQKRAEEQLSSAMAGMVTQGNIEAEQEAVRKREEKRKADEEAAAKVEADRLAAEEAAVAEEAAAAAAAAAADPVARVRHALAEQGPGAAAAAVKALDLEGGVADRMRVIYEALLDGGGEEKPATAVGAHAGLLKALARDPASQMAQLIAAEAFFADAPVDQVKEVALVLKTLYDEDVVEEGLIIAWHDKANAGKVLGVAPAAAERVRIAAAPFVDWLREAESDDSDEEEEDED